jgi:hypothetical protein
MKLINQEKSYRHLLILESSSWWESCESSFNPEEDIVLTFDFGLKNLVESLGGQAFYVDSLCAPEEMQKNNLLADEFFKKWHFDEYGNDIFTEQGVPFGFAFRIEIWSEYLHYVRLRANLEQLKKLKYKKIFVGESNDFLKVVLGEVGSRFELVDQKNTSNNAVYFFDIHKYMFDALHAKSLKNVAKNIMIWASSNIGFVLDMLSNKRKKTIYAQIYHPTKPIISRLLKRSDLRIVTSSLVTEKGWRKFFFQRLIPIRGRNASFEKKADVLLGGFRKKRVTQLILNDGTDVTDGVYAIIERQIKHRVSEALRILNSTVAYVVKHPIHLELMIANIGLVQTIVDCVLKTKGVPSYLIINGLMPSTFGDEAKYASYINCYGIETKKNYYQDAEHVICLGDPRIDAYMNSIKEIARLINRMNPVVSIGTSGFNPLDFNSYVAVEFEFMYEVLTSFQELKNEGQLFSIIIKVRPNGVLDQYKSFIEEYFPELEIDLLREVSMMDVLKKTDLYISIYSQTLFEASCLGIPAIYYKKDKEYLDAPFDGKSELVTVNTVSELKQAFVDFKNANSRFDKFLDRSVMEKYIGPLDGNNTARNIDFIYGLIDIPKIGALH